MLDTTAYIGSSSAIGDSLEEGPLRPENDRSGFESFDCEGDLTGMRQGTGLRLHRYGVSTGWRIGGQRLGYHSRAATSSKQAD